MGLGILTTKLTKISEKSLERTIKEVEDSESKIQKAEDNSEIELINYKKQIEEKLPRIIDGIDILAPQIIKISRYSISNIGKETSVLFHDYSYKKEGDILCQRDGGEILPGMFIDINCNSNNKYGFSFIFDRDSKSIRAITLSAYGAVIHSSTKKEFIEEFLGSIEELIKQGSWENGPIKLPIILAKIPNLVAEYYKKVSAKKTRSSENISSLNKELSSLKIPNIL